MDAIIETDENGRKRIKPTKEMRVETWTGERGAVVYGTEDGWLGVRLDGERRVDEWQAFQLKRI